MSVAPNPPRNLRRAANRIAAVIVMGLSVPAFGSVIVTHLTTPSHVAVVAAGMSGIASFVLFLLAWVVDRLLGTATVSLGLVAFVAMVGVWSNREMFYDKVADRPADQRTAATLERYLDVEIGDYDARGRTVPVRIHNRAIDKASVVIAVEMRDRSGAVVAVDYSLATLGGRKETIVDLKFGLSPKSSSILMTADFRIGYAYSKLLENR